MSLKYVCALVGLISLALGATLEYRAQENITEDSYFFGQSPPVYPSPSMPGKGDSAEAYTKAITLVSKMTLEEQANITVGYATTSGCAGITADFVTGWPSGIHVGASWNRNLAYETASLMGGEFKTKGVNVILGPMVGPLGKLAVGGRNWEGFSNDPFLSGQLTAETVRGTQEAGVITSVKHLIGNEQETNRKPTPNTNISAVYSNIDHKMVHELYLWPFQDTLHSGAGAVLCGYQRINNSYSCQNSKAQNGLVKLRCVEAGLDIAMPYSYSYWGTSGGNLTIAIQNGSLPESRLNDMATRIVAAWYQIGQEQDFPSIGMRRDLTISHVPRYARKPASKVTSLNGAIEGHVLVKNVNNALPLKTPKLLSVFGYDAQTTPLMDVPLVAGTRVPWSVGDTAYLGRPAYGAILASCDVLSQIGANGILIGGGGSGGISPAYISSPFDALQERAYQDESALFWDFVNGNPAVDTSSDACLVFINSYAAEENDRPGLHDDFSDGLVLNVAQNCSSTIVVIHNAGLRLVDQWIEHPNITAVIFAHLPGQESGRAIVQILYGDVSPSGKLPYTVPKNESDINPNLLNPALPEGQYSLFAQDDFTEGVDIDYRDFDARNITPRYEFGFGLTYSTFEYTDLSISLLPNATTSYLPPQKGIVMGEESSLWDIVAQVSATVRNMGSVEAAEIAQLYVSIPNGPTRQLRGFSKVSIAAGSDAMVEFNLTRRDLSEWNVVEQTWVLQQADYGIWFGASSRDLPLVGSLTV